MGQQGWTVVEEPRSALVPGNVDLYAQPKVKNPDGSISTVDSSSYSLDGKEYLLPSVTPDGRHLKTPAEIVAEFRKTGRHLGVFDTPEHATAYAQQLHNDYAAGKYDRRPSSVGWTPVAEPNFKAENAKDASGNAVVDFLGEATAGVNPVNIYHALKSVALDLPGTVKRIGEAQGSLYQKAEQSYKAKDYVAAARHMVNYLIPIIGPRLDEAGDFMQQGQYAKGMGATVDVGGMIALPSAARAVKGAVRAIPNAIADSADASAARRIGDVISPKVGANKVRIGNQAERIAPALARDLADDGAPVTRSGYHQQVQGKLAVAEQSLDAASDARLSARSFPVQPLIADLLKKRAQLTAESVEGSRTVPTVKGPGGRPTQSGMTRNVSTGQMQKTLTKEGRPLGADVVPGPNAGRVAVIDQAISELRQLGPVTRYDPIRTIRQAYDGQAKVVYSPAVTADYLKARGSALGAADVTGTLRETLAKWDPETATANAQYSLYRTADDVMSATAEVERTRPKVGRQIIARMAGTMVGANAAGVPGAVAGYIGGPILDSALASGATTQLKTAAMLTRLARAIRGGRVGEVASLSAQLRRMGQSATAAQVVRAQGSGGQMVLPAAATMPSEQPTR